MDIYNAPIIIFAFNRLDTLKRCVTSLQKNTEAKNSDLFVFVDGAREKHDGEAEKVWAVQQYVLSITGFKSVNHRFSKTNRGLAQSIISGTTEIINKYGRVIVVEDDLYLSKSFLRYMNEMLNRYKNDTRVMQVSGYGSKLKKSDDYTWDIYLNERAQSWSWGTWKDRWEYVDWDVKDFARLQTSKKLQRAFCKRGSDLYGMLKGYMDGRNNSWYIRFNYSMHKQHKYSVCPVRSLVRNDGFTAEATHCNTYNRYKIDFEEHHEGQFHVPERLTPNERIMRDAVKYWSLRYRIYGKLRTYWMKLTKKQQ